MDTSEKGKTTDIWINEHDFANKLAKPVLILNSNGNRCFLEKGKPISYGNVLDFCYAKMRKIISSF